MGRVRALPAPVGRADGSTGGRPGRGVRYRPRNCPRRSDGRHCRGYAMSSARELRRRGDRGVLRGERLS